MNKISDEQIKALRNSVEDINKNDDSSLKKIKDEFAKLAAMTVDSTIRLLTIERILFEKGIVQPGEHSQIITEVSNDFAANVEIIMAKMREQELNEN